MTETAHFQAFEALQSLALQRFLSRYVETSEELAILLRLVDHQHRFLSIAAVAGSLAMEESVAEVVLEKLVTNGLVVQHLGAPAVFQYIPQDAARASDVERLRVAYEKDKRHVLRLMLCNAVQRIESLVVAYKGCLGPSEPFEETPDDAPQESAARTDVRASEG